jgi:hypothetical protein
MTNLDKALWALPAGRTNTRRGNSAAARSPGCGDPASPARSHPRPLTATDLVLPTLTRDGKSIAVSICAEHGAVIAVLDSLPNHASTATRGGVIGTYQRALLIEATRKVMALWDRLLRNAVGLSPAETAEPQLVQVA